MSMTNPRQPTSERRMRPRFSFRAFYITTCILSTIAILSLVAHQTVNFRYGAEYSNAQRFAAAQLDINRLLKREEECRLVHFADDKCAFIKANCPDEEAGLLSYLSLYYCALPKAQPVAFAILVLWLGLLFSTIGIAASDFFCINLSTIASILGMSESMAGVTFLAFGNGSPDVFSTFAAMNSHSGSLAIGELMGAAGFITTVVAGSMALVREFKVGKKTFVRDIGFFIVAVSFSMVFLSDGALRLWECCVMIGFYVFYVVTVVIWHWYLQRQRKRRERLAAAHGHHYNSGDVEIEVQEEYHDDEDVPTGERRSLISRRSTDDWATLESGNGSPALSAQAEDDDDDNEGPQGIRLATEMSNSMRVLHPTGRRNTLNPIRPSLVGAMEFRSVLSSLQKSRNSRSRPIHLRRYSDEAHASGATSAPTSGPPSLSVPDESEENIVIIGPDGEDHIAGGHSFTRPGTTSRTRALSMNNVSTDKPRDPAAFSVAKIPDIGVIAATPTFPPSRLQMPRINTALTASSVVKLSPGDKSDNASLTLPVSPTFSISPPPSENDVTIAAISREVSPSPLWQFEDRLAPPGSSFPGRPSRRSASPRNFPRSPIEDVSPRASPPLRPKLTISPTDKSSGTPVASPIQAFPTYTDYEDFPETPTRRPSLLELPEPDLALSHSYTGEITSIDTPKLVKWWPYRWLPDPYVMLAALFPTLFTWTGKSIIDKFLSIVSTPSIFLLAITLPVVEAESDANEVDPMDEVDPFGQLTSESAHQAPRLAPDTPSIEPGEVEEGEWRRYRRATLISRSRTSSRSPSPSPALAGFAGHGNTASSAIEAEHDYLHPSHHAHHPHHAHPPRSPAFPFPNNSASKSFDDTSKLASTSVNEDLRDPHSWNRWLVIIQIFTAPMFIVFIIWANTEAPEDSPSNMKYLFHLVLYSLLFSLIALAGLLLTTSAYVPPKHRFLLCFLGFVVSISWISTIANEVVGVLKAFGVILGISDAILGLTIFAVGNSLGDLVADITVARLGYPVMALSACFGGPMLNILIGIGVSGLYMTIKDADHKHHKHPEKHIRYRPYEIEVSNTLMISACALLITLLGLLIAVPLNGWVMSRKIGFGLIALWCVSTVVNLGVEITGVLG